MKGSFPAVIALLASPQFMIAAGVGVGVIVVALGGYKVVKKMKARQTAPAYELQEIGRDVNRIEAWRRGISDEGDLPNTMAGLDDATTVVDGEFITPQAAAMMHHERHRQQERESERGSGRGHGRSHHERDLDRDREWSTGARQAGRESVVSDERKKQKRSRKEGGSRRTAAGGSGSSRGTGEQKKKKGREGGSSTLRLVFK